VFVEERGMTLVMALGVMVGLTTITTTTIVYTARSVHATGLSRASTSAYDVAEAGINDSIAKMNGQLDTDGSVLTGGISPLSPTLFPSCFGSPVPTPSKLPYSNVTGAEAWICGDYNATSSAVVSPAAIGGYSWRIQSVGRVSNAGLIQTRTLLKSVKVVGINDGADNSSWSRFYQDSATPCLTIDTETFVTNVATRGDLCLLNTGAVTGSGTTVDVGGNVFITGPPVDSAPRAPTTAVAGWTSPTSVFANDTVYATNSIATVATGATQDAKGFFNTGTAIPANAKIFGISVSVERLASVCCNVNEKETITETGSPTAGSFTLTGTPPGGTSKTSASIAWNASAATVTTALVATTMYGTGNVACTGGPLPTAVACTFQGADASMPITTMTFTRSGFSPTAATPVITTNTNGVSATLRDSNVQLLKAGSATGISNYASGNTWSTSTPTTVTYGDVNDLWGTTWTAADVNNANFGVRFAAQNTGAQSATASIDYISITVTYSNDTNGIGATGAGNSILQANIGGTCTYNAQSAHSPCTAATDHVNATTIATVPVAANPAISMPVVDFNYWWANAMPGPKHFCTYKTGTYITNGFFDNDAALAGTAPNQYSTGNTTGPNKSLKAINGEMAPPGQSYVCQVWSGGGQVGTLLGELSWDATKHILTIFGTIFVDGNFRFDQDGEVVNYKGRATLMSSTDDEIDAVVCADGDVTTPPTSVTGSCVDKTGGVSNMASWVPTKNMMVLMSQGGNAPQPDNEYDQGGTNCAGNTPPTCFNGHTASGFQGILYSTGDCLIHQNFQDSGPVICDTISLPNESGINPTFYTFPVTGNLTDGQKFSNTPTATNFQLDAGDQSGG
jgi:hypothetical protein